MTKLNQHEFVCVDVESTGLDPEQDRVIEVACVVFTLDNIIDEFETLINPGKEIPEASIAIHNITNEMVSSAPTIDQILPQLFKHIGKRVIVGHSVGFDVDILRKEAERANLPTSIQYNKIIDTVRLARLYGESPSNSLENLRQHFNIEAEGAHRAKGDVLVNIQVFQRLITNFKTLEEIDKALSKPILMKTMPLGKHRGRLIKDLPLDYLMWASRQQFDQDLSFSLKHELQRRKRGGTFTQSSNPFSNL